MRRNQAFSRVNRRERLLPRDRLARVDLLAERVDARDRVVDVRPRVERRDVDAVAVEPALIPLSTISRNGEPLFVGVPVIQLERRHD